MSGGLVRKLGLVFALVLAPSAALATVTTGTYSVEYSPSSDTTAFEVTFPFLAASHLVVVKTLEATGVDTTLTLGTDYTVTLPGTSAHGASTNGRVTTTAAVTSAYTLTITRDTPLTQSTSFRTQGTFRPGTHEDGFDKLTMIVQELASLTTGDADITTAINDHEAESDPHTGYFRLLGRSGGQHGRGDTASGGNLQLSSTAHATKGKLLFGSNGTELVVDDSLNCVSVGDATCSTTLDVNGTTTLAGAVTVSGALTSTSTAQFTDITALDDVIVTDDITAESGVFSGDVTLDSTLYGGDADGDNLNLRATSASAGQGQIRIGVGGGPTATDGLRYDEETGYVSIGAISTPTVMLDVRGEAIVRRKVEVALSSPEALTASGSDCNKVFVADTVSTTEFQLPSLADADSDGCVFTFIVSDGKPNIRVTTETDEEVIGTCGSTNFNTNGKGIYSDTSAPPDGDFVTVVGVGTNTDIQASAAGWYIIGCEGVWTAEP
jgi:hypothetical protein